MPRSKMLRRMRLAAAKEKERLAEEAKKIVTGRFIAICKKALEYGRRTADGHGKAHHVRLANQYRELYLVHLRGLTAYDEEINARQDEKLLAAESESLRKTELVDTVSVEDGRLVVTTLPIVCTEPRSGDQYMLGNFRLRIDLYSGNITIENMTGSRDRAGCPMNAPHVAGDGRPCWGSVDETIVQLVAKCQISTLVQVIIAFLQTVNINDAWGECVVLWPKINTQKRPRPRLRRLQTLASGGTLRHRRLNP